MKKFLILLMLIVAMLSLTACPDFIPKTPASLEFETTEYSISSDGGQLEIRFMPFVDWTVSCNEDWLTYSPLSGKASEQEAVIIVTVSPNISSQRMAQLTVSSEFDDVVITITQDELVVGNVIDVDELVFTHENGEVYLDFVSPVDWVVSCDADWIYVTPESGSAFKSSHITVSYSYNESKSERKTVINFIFGSVVQSVSVTQSGREVSQPDIPSEEIPEGWFLCRSIDNGSTWETFEFTSFENGMLVYKGFYVPEGTFIRFYDSNNEMYYACPHTYIDQQYKTNSRLDIVSEEVERWLYFPISYTYDIYVHPNEKHVYIMTSGYSPEDLPTRENVMHESYSSLERVSDGEVVKVFGVVMAMSGDGYIIALDTRYYNNIFVYDPQKLHDVTLGCWLDLYAKVQTNWGLKNLVVDESLLWYDKIIDHEYEYTTEAPLVVDDLLAFDNPSHVYIRTVGTLNISKNSAGQINYYIVGENSTDSMLSILSPVMNLTNYEKERVLVEGYYMGHEKRDNIVCQNLILKRIVKLDDDSVVGGSTQVVMPGGSITVTNILR